MPRRSTKETRATMASRRLIAQTAEVEQPRTPHRSSAPVISAGDHRNRNLNLHTSPPSVQAYPANPSSEGSSSRTSTGQDSDGGKPGLPAHGAHRGETGRRETTLAAGQARVIRRQRPYVRPALRTLGLVQVVGEFPDVPGRIGEARGPHAPRPVHRAVEQPHSLISKLGAGRIDVIDPDGEQDA